MIPTKNQLAIRQFKRNGFKEFKFCPIGKGKINVFNPKGHLCLILDLNPFCIEDISFETEKWTKYRKAKINKLKKCGTVEPTCNDKKDSKKCCCKHLDIEVKHEMLSSFVDTNNQRHYIVEVTICNKGCKKIKKLSLIESLIKPDFGIAISPPIRTCPKNSTVVPNSIETAQEVWATGELLDPSSFLKPCEQVKITYDLVNLRISNQCNCLNSSITINGKVCDSLCKIKPFNSVIKLGCRDDNNSTTTFSTNQTDITTSPLPSNCVKFEDEGELIEIGVENITKCVTVNGEEICVRLFNWIAKVGEPDEYIEFSWEITGGCLEQATAKGANIFKPFGNLNDTSGTFTPPISKGVGKKGKEVFGALSNIIFCLKPCPPMISVSKTADKTEACVDDIINYNVTITNIGVNKVFITSIQDSLAGDLITQGICIPPAFLLPGEFFDCGYSYIVLETDPGTLINTITVKAQNSIGEETTVSDSFTVELATITVRKNIIGQKPFDIFQIEIQGPTMKTFMNVGDNFNSGPISVKCGDYTIEEFVNPPGDLGDYDILYRCLRNGSQFDSGTTAKTKPFTVMPGDKIVCIFRNNKK